MGQANGGEFIQLASNRPSQMLAAYRANMQRGCLEVREMIIDDIRRFSELGAHAYVDDLNEALSLFDEASFLAACPKEALGAFALIRQ